MCWCLQSTVHEWEVYDGGSSDVWCVWMFFIFYLLNDDVDGDYDVMDRWLMSLNGEMCGG